MVFKKIYLLVDTINEYPLTFKKAVLLCFFVEGVWFIASLFFHRINLSSGIMPEIIFLAAVLLTARMMGKDELRRILAWRDIPLPLFAGIFIMFFGWDIIRSELRNFFEMLLPIPDGFFGDRFHIRNNLFIVILTGALFPGFTEEVFFRGIIARRFFRTCSPVRAVLLSAVLFGIFHLNPWQAVGAFLGGIFYGWIYYRYKSIWLCMFSHAYHNILASFSIYPYTRIDNSNYLEWWHHPLWFDILGLLLFGFGLLTVIVLSRKRE